MFTDNIFIKIEAKNTKAAAKLEQIIHSIEGLQVQRSDDTQRANLLILELGTDSENAFHLIESRLNAGSVDEIFLTAEDPEQDVLMQAIRSGVKEFLPQPLDEEDVRQALTKFKERRGESRNTGPAKSGKIINVVGTKGGVGTTTIAVNLAASLLEEKPDRSVALVDMNMLYGEIPLFLEIKPKHNLEEITKHISRLDTTFLMNVLSKSSTGIYVLPSPSHFNGGASTNPKIMERLLGVMRKMFDFVVIDGGQSLGEISFKILELSDTVLLVSVLSLPCLSNTDKLLKSLDDLGYPVKKKIKIVINRHLKNSEISLKDAEDAIGKKIFWTVPNDYGTTLSAINQGKVLSQIAAKAAITKNLKDFANAVNGGGIAVEKVQGSFLKGWQRIKGKKMMHAVK
jgi:pilus assembly protein CpaE